MYLKYSTLLFLSVILLCTSYQVRVYAASRLISWSIELTAVAGRQLAPACPLLHAHFADIPWERAPRAAEDARGAPWGTYSNVVV